MGLKRVLKQKPARNSNLSWYKGWIPFTKQHRRRFIDVRVPSKRAFKSALREFIPENAEFKEIKTLRHDVHATISLIQRLLEPSRSPPPKRGDFLSVKSHVSEMMDDVERILNLWEEAERTRFRHQRFIKGVIKGLSIHPDTKTQMTEIKALENEIARLHKETKDELRGLYSVFNEYHQALSEGLLLEESHTGDKKEFNLEHARGLLSNVNSLDQLSGIADELLGKQHTVVGDLQAICAGIQKLL